MENVGTAILNVFLIIGLIVAAAFIIVFLADLLLSVIDGNNGIFFKRGKAKAHEQELITEPVKEEEKQLLLNNDFRLDFDDEKNEQHSGEVDLDAAEKERLAMLGNKQETKLDVVDTPKTEQPETQKDDEDLDKLYAQLIADINNEALKNGDEDKDDFLKDVKPKEENTDYLDLDNDTEEKEDLDDNRFKTLQDQIEELKRIVEAQYVEKPVTEETVETPATIETPVVEEKVQEPAIDESATRIEILTKQIEEMKQVQLRLEDELAKRNLIPAVTEESLDSLQERKELLESRLKSAEKELKSNNKEYIPLRRIAKTLENDEAKLRRKEAVVAKQKVLMFGVNNYVEDAEKEQRLKEELEQLDGLRLSVQHCKTVMQDNQDRYPILEKTNGILRNQVDQIKYDIAMLDARIASRQGK